MTLVDDLQDVVDAGRRLARDLGLRPRTVTIKSDSTSPPGSLAEITAGPSYGEGSSHVIDPPPRIRSAPTLRGADGGIVETGRIVADRISVKDYTREDLERDGDAIWIVDDIEYVPVQFERRAFRWVVTLERKNRGR